METEKRVHAALDEASGLMPYVAEYSQIRTDTGRLAGDFQQVPRVVLGEPNLRDAVAAPDGMSLLEADYSMIQIRIAAWRAQEETMLDLLRRGADIHAYSGRALFGIPEHGDVPKIARQTGKTFNFASLFEAGADKLAEVMMLNLSEEDLRRAQEQLHADTLQEAAALLHHRWHETYPGIRLWHAHEKARIRQAGKSVAPHGRIKHVPKIFSKEPRERAEGFREGINHVIQSPETDLTLLAATIAVPALYEHYGVRAGPWPSHDSLLFMGDAATIAYAAAYLKLVMEQHAPRRFGELFGVMLDVPIVADVKTGHRWGSLSSINITPILLDTPTLSDVQSVHPMKGV